MLEFDGSKSYAQLTYDEAFYIGYMESGSGMFVNMALLKVKKEPEVFESMLREMVEEEYNSIDMIQEIRAFQKKFPDLNRKQLFHKLIKESEYKFI